MCKGPVVGEGNVNIEGLKDSLSGARDFGCKMRLEK